MHWQWRVGAHQLAAAINVLTPRKFAATTVQRGMAGASMQHILAETSDGNAQSFRWTGGVVSQQHLAENSGPGTLAQQ